MKTGQTIIACYEDYLNLCSSLRLQVHEKKLEELLKFDKSLLINPLPFGTCLIDYSQKKYLHTSQNTEDITGYNSSDFPNGPESQVSKMHPDDRQIFTEHLFPDIIHYLLTLPISEYERYRFSFSYRYFRKDSSMTHLLQQSTYLEPTSDGKPLLNMVVFSDIGDFKTDDRMILTISYLAGTKGYIPIFKKHYTAQEYSHISGRELQILRLSMEGLSSKLIAEKLYLSIHTVKNHKRNMMDKTSSRNISELIHYAVKNKLIY
jgi:Response regulator containing a CheY-like receiver domain and an HTH DNA-binding domain